MRELGYLLLVAALEMTDNPEITAILSSMLADLLEVYNEKVSAEGTFNDVRLKRQVYFGDPGSSQPGLLELTVMCMDEKLNPENRYLRFVALRVKKSPRGGTVSSTCFHGTKEDLRVELEREMRSPSVLLERVDELASGLPEETNPELWR